MAAKPKKAAEKKPAGNPKELKLRCLEAAVALAIPSPGFINATSPEFVIANAESFYIFVTGDSN